MKLGISSDGLHDFFFPHKGFHFTKNTGSECTGKANSKLGLNSYDHQLRRDNWFGLILNSCELFSSFVIISSPVSKKLGPITPSLRYFKGLTLISSLLKFWKYHTCFVSIEVWIHTL